LSWSIALWVPDALYHRILNTARLVGTEKLKPIYLALGEKVEYDEIRLVVAHMVALANSAAVPRDRPES